MTGLRRRWSFGMRTMFVVVALLAMPMGWVGYQLNWIRERHAFLSGKRASIPGLTPSPLSLRLFGEYGQTTIYVAQSKDIDEARRLFPESYVAFPPE